MDGLDAYVRGLVDGLQQLGTTMVVVLVAATVLAALVVVLIGWKGKS